ncbi:hypothetical protein V6O07_03730, partial [Arthrospira platensis SPKY2]
MYLNLQNQETNFHQYLDFLAGRYLVIYEKEGNVRVLHDACGTKTIYYYILSRHSSQILISSHLDLIHKIADVPNVKIKQEFYSMYMNKFFPGNLTPLDQVYILTPNTLLDVKSCEIVRYYPREILKEEQDLDRLIESISTNLVKQLTL